MQSQIQIASNNLLNKKDEEEYSFPSSEMMIKSVSNGANSTEECGGLFEGSAAGASHSTNPVFDNDETSSFEIYLPMPKLFKDCIFEFPDEPLPNVEAFSPSHYVEVSLSREAC